MNLLRKALLLGAASAVFVSCQDDYLEEAKDQSNQPISSSNELRSGVNQNFLWKTGKKIKVKIQVFDNSGRKADLLVKNCFLDWMQYANLNFEFVESGQDFSVVVIDDAKEKSSGSSYVGIGCLCEKYEPAVQLILGGESLEVRRGTVLHEIGHVLGFLHEHQAYHVDWSSDAKEFFTQHGISSNQAREQILTDESKYAINVIKDPKSVMTYDIPHEGTIHVYNGSKYSEKNVIVTNDGFETVRNYVLSSGDKTIAKKTYPHKYPNSKPFVRTKRTCNTYFYCTISELLNCKSEDLISGYEKIECRLFGSDTKGTKPLYRYNSDKYGDHFYTTDWKELGAGKDSYKYEYVAGYVFPTKSEGTIALYRYYRPGIGDHYYTTDWEELGSGKNGYKYERIAGYVLPASEY